MRDRDGDVLGGVALVLFVLLFFRLWFVQVINGSDYLAEANSNRTREFRVDEYGAPRYPELVLAVKGADAAGEVHPVEHARQANVREDHRDVIAIAAKNTERFLGILAFHDPQVGLLEQRCGQFAKVRIVLDNQRDESLFAATMRFHVSPHNSWWRKYPRQTRRTNTRVKPEARHLVGNTRKREPVPAKR